MLKQSENPPSLPAGLASPGAASGNWWVAHTRPRSEKAVAWALAARGVNYFLPMARRTLTSGGRRRTTLIPLFPSYLFFCGDDRARLNALSTRRLVQILPVARPELFVAELDAVYVALTANADLNVFPFAVVGRRCRVARGPLRGIEGTLVMADNVTRFVLQVSVLARGAWLEIDAAFLEAAN